MKPREWLILDNGEEPCMAYADVVEATLDGVSGPRTTVAVEKSAFDHQSLLLEKLRDYLGPAKWKYLVGDE